MNTNFLQIYNYLPKQHPIASKKRIWRVKNVLMRFL